MVRLIVAVCAAAGTLVLLLPQSRDRLAARSARQRRALGLPTSERSERVTLIGMAAALALVAVLTVIPLVT